MDIVEQVLGAERALQAAMRASDVEDLDRLLHRPLTSIEKAVCRNKQPGRV